MRVGAEPGARLVADDGSRAGDLAACPIEHAPIDACLRARGPRQVLMSHDDSFAVVRVDEHRSLGRIAKAATSLRVGSGEDHVWSGRSLPFAERWRCHSTERLRKLVNSRF